MCDEVLGQPSTSSANKTPGANNSLLLVDELGSVTDPARGVSISPALLKILLDYDSRVAISSHFTSN